MRFQNNTPSLLNSARANDKNAIYLLVMKFEILTTKYSANKTTKKATKKERSEVFRIYNIPL
jgi:hypothetical protein